MLKVFKVVIFFSTFLIHGNSLACSLKKGHSFISISGPVTHLLEELNLLEDPALKAISAFHPVKNEKVKKIAGGIFISPKTLSRFDSPVVFFDSSRELKKVLGQSGVNAKVEVDTRGKEPFAASEVALAALEPHLKECSKNLEDLRAQLKKIKTSLMKTSLPAKDFIFYLGSFKKEQKPPELVMVNDGFVKFLKDNKEMKTYPGSLAYLPWSQRILAKMDRPIFIGVQEARGKDLEIERVEKNIYNIGFQGVLTPGIRQVFFLKKLLDSKFFGKFI